MSIEELCARVCGLGPACGLEPLLRETVAAGGEGLEILMKVALEANDKVEGDTNGYYYSEGSDSETDPGTDPEADPGTDPEADPEADSETDSDTVPETNSDTDPEDLISDEDVEDTLKAILPHGHRHELRARIGVERCGAFQVELAATRQRRAEEDAEYEDTDTDTDSEFEDYEQEMLAWSEVALVQTAQEAGLDLGGLAANHITYFRGRAQGDRAGDHDLQEVEEMIEDLECGLEERDAAVARLEAVLDQLPAHGRRDDPEVAAAAAVAEQLLDGYPSSEELHGAALGLRAAVLAAEAKAPAHKKAAMKRDRDDYEGVIKIREEQRSASRILDARDFNHLLRAVGARFTADFRYTPEAADALRAAAEDYLVGLFHDSGRAAIHAQRTHVQPKDMNFVLRLRA